MAYKAERLRSFAPSGVEYYSYWLDWVSYGSPRDPSGKLRLYPQEFLLTRNVTPAVTQVWPESGYPFPPIGSNVTNLPDWPSSLDQLARSRAYARMKGPSSALAMTIATLGQTRDMIVAKSDYMTKQTVDMTRRIQRDKKSGRLTKRNTSLANAWLEYFYGWNPFFSDIHDGLKTIAELTPEVAWISGRAKAPVNQRQESGTDPKVTLSFLGEQRSTYNFRAEVTQPNLWMANRLGLINPGAVLWDLIPWSFVVNMFVNANALISSVSDEVGLAVDGYNLTTTTRVTRVHSQVSLDGRTYTTSTTAMTEKRRTLGYLPIQVVYKRPTLGWELAVTASSLLLQKVNRLNKVMPEFLLRR